MAKRVRVNYKRFFTVIFCFLIVAALVVLLITKIGGDNEKNETSSQSSQSVSSTQSEAEIPYETRVGKNYEIDISPYLKYIEPETDEYVFLVNPTHTLAADYVPDDLTDCGITRQDGRATQKLRLYAQKSLEAMMAEAKQNGITDVTATSAYRSYDYQNTLFNQYCNENQYKFKTREECEKYVLTFSTKPGTSEHQSGLCLDMHNLPAADQAFAKTDAAKWLADNCYRFGFILRYPEDKQDVTNIIYEPWHFRYVGRRFATEMHEKNMCLEEYIKYLGKE